MDRWIAEGKAGTNPFGPEPSVPFAEAEWTQGQPEPVDCPNNLRTYSITARFANQYTQDLPRARQSVVNKRETLKKHINDCGIVWF
jgi:hypothetical protein